MNRNSQINFNNNTSSGSGGAGELRNSMKKNIIPPSIQSTNGQLSRKKDSSF